MALRPQANPTQVGARVTKDGTVVAAPSVTGATPKFLIRYDGVVRLYDPILAEDPAFRPSNTLPSEHVAAVKNAIYRDDNARQAQIRAEHDQAVREAALAESQTLMEAKMREDFLALEDEISANTSAQDKFDTDVFVISTADYAGLQRFCDNNGVDYVVINTKPIEQVRAEVRAIAEQMLADSKEPADTKTPAASVAPSVPDAGAPESKTKLKAMFTPTAPPATAPATPVWATGPSKS